MFAEQVLIFQENPLHDAIYRIRKPALLSTMQKNDVCSCMATTLLYCLSAPFCVSIAPSTPTSVFCARIIELRPGSAVLDGAEASRPWHCDRFRR